ncbi:MAG: ABC transporter substrate-binding protein [Fusobacteriota bacterium]
MKKKVLSILGIMLFTTAMFAENIKIGMLTPLSGPIAIYGQATLNGIKLATEELNEAGGIKGKNVELIIEDNKGDAAEAVNSAKKIMNVDDIKALLGPVISTNSLAVAPIMQENKIPMITPTGTSSQITKVGDYIARTCFIDEFQGAVMANFASNNLDAKKAVLMTDLNSDYSKGLAEEFTKVFEANGGEIADEVSYSANDVDFTSQLTKIKAKKPDVIFVPGYYNEVSLIVKQARDLKIDSVFLGGDGWDNGKLFEIAGDSINGSYISTHFSPESEDEDIQNFLKNYRARFGEDPSVLAALGYDAAGVMFEAMKKTENLERDEIKQQINSTEDYKGVTGTITIDKNRNAQKSAFVLEAKDGEFVYEATIAPMESVEKEPEATKAEKAEEKEEEEQKSSNTTIIIIVVLAAIVGIALYNRK